MKLRKDEFQLEKYSLQLNKAPRGLKNNLLRQEKTILRLEKGNLQLRNASNMLEKKAGKLEKEILQLKVGLLQRRFMVEEAAPLGQPLLSRFMILKREFKIK